MKVAIYSESPADEAALRILVDALLGAPTEPIDFPWLKSRGWPSIQQNLPKVVQYLHYRTDAEGLVVVVDSNKSPLPTQPFHNLVHKEDQSRIGRLQGELRLVRARLASVPERPELKVTLGLAVPAIEAWYRCGVDSSVNEAAWIRALRSNEYTYDASRLKRDVYASDRPTLELARKVAVEQAQRLVGEGRLGLLEQLFPIGFGSLADAVRSW
jgi:hypothetical protein